MTILLVVLIIALIGVLVAIYIRLGYLIDSAEAEVSELRELRLTSRTRIKNFAVQSGAVTSEQKLARLGRASAAQRVVFGGEDDSTLNQTLVRQSKVGRRQGGEDDG